MKELYVVNPEMSAQMNEKMNKNKNKNKKLVIFGTGTHAKGTFAELLQRNIKADYFADRDQKVTGLKLYGIEVLAEEDLGKMDCQVIVASTYWKEIVKRLEDAGINSIYVDTNRYKYGTQAIDLL